MSLLPLLLDRETTLDADFELFLSPVLFLALLAPDAGSRGALFLLVTTLLVFNDCLRETMGDLLLEAGISVVRRFLIPFELFLTVIFVMTSFSPVMFLLDILREFLDLDRRGIGSCVCMPIRLPTERLRWRLCEEIAVLSLRSKLAGTPDAIKPVLSRLFPDCCLLTLRGALELLVYILAIGNLEVPSLVPTVPLEVY